MNEQNMEIRAKKLLETRALRLVKTKIIQKCQALASIKGEHYGEYATDYNYKLIKNKFKEYDIFIDNNGSGMYRGCDNLRVEFLGKIVLKATEEPYNHPTFPAIILDKNEVESSFDHYWISRYIPGIWEKEVEKAFNSISDLESKLQKTMPFLMKEKYNVNPKFIKKLHTTKLTAKKIEIINERFQNYER